MKIAVTGASGELGRSLVPYLEQTGHEVVPIDRTPPVTPQSPLPSYKICDVTDFGEVVAGLAGCDAVVHLAAHRSPDNHPHPVVYRDNTVGSYNVLYAAATLGIERICLASSVNAIGAAFSRNPRFDYFPIDENHPTYTEDPYSLSKWVLEQQADSFARRYEWMTIASLRFHWLAERRQDVVERSPLIGETAINHLWAYTLLSAASEACLLSLTADFNGHEPFFIVAPDTVIDTPSRELAERHYPDTPLRAYLPDHSSFYDCRKAGRLLGWTHPG